MLIALVTVSSLWQKNLETFASDLVNRRQNLWPRPPYGRTSFLQEDIWPVPSQGHEIYGIEYPLGYSPYSLLRRNAVEKVSAGLEGFMDSKIMLKYSSWNPPPKSR